MTRSQIAEAIGMSANSINNAFTLAIKEHPELNMSGLVNIDYSLDQVLLAMKYLHNGKGASQLEKVLIEESFTMKQPEKAVAIGVPGTEEFLEKIKKRPKTKCCSTCSFCVRSWVKNQKPVAKAFCTLWDRFIFSMKGDPYNDHCVSWEYSNKAPLIFYTADSPNNVDIYGNINNEVMGYDIKEFGKKSKGLVTDVGLNLDELNDDASDCNN